MGAEDAAAVDLATELNFMTFRCEDDTAEGDVYSGILTADEDGRDIWKDHPVSEAEGCTYPVIDFYFTVPTGEARNCGALPDDEESTVETSSEEEESTPVEEDESTPDEEEEPESVSSSPGGRRIAPIVLSAVSASAVIV